MRMLVALDETSRAPHVLDVALRTAERLKGVVVPFRAIQVPAEFPPAAATHHKDELPEVMTAEAERSLDHLMPAGGTVPVRIEEPVVRTGLPWRAIVATADAQAADMIVVGSHGYRGLDHVLGTTSRHVADAARHDVLVVHDRPVAADVRSVLIALNGSPRDPAIFAHGLSVAHAWGARVHLVRVLPLAARRTAEASSELSELAASDPAIESRRVVRTSLRPWRAIIAAARERGVDLIVVGSHDHRRWDALERSTAGHMADSARADVLVVHETPAAGHARVSRRRRAGERRT